jgi:cold shock protein
MLEGMVKTYHNNRAFGFIRPDCGGADVFFHLKSFPPGVTPEAGARVSYNLAPDQRSGKLQAVSVKVLAVGRSAVLAQFVRLRLPARQSFRLAHRSCFPTISKPLASSSSRTAFASCSLSSALILMAPIRVIVSGILHEWNEWLR